MFDVINDRIRQTFVLSYIPLAERFKKIYYMTKSISFELSDSTKKILCHNTKLHYKGKIIYLHKFSNEYKGKV